MNAATTSPACRHSVAAQIFRDALEDSESMSALLAAVPELDDLIDAQARRLDEAAVKRASKRKGRA